MGITRITTGEDLPVRVGITSTGGDKVGTYEFDFNLVVGSGVPRVNNDGASSLAFYEDGTLVGQRSRADFVDSETVAFNITDDPSNSKVIITATATGSGNGDVSSSISSSVDNRIVRFDGLTGKLIQQSHVLLDDNGNIYASGLFGPGSGIYNLNASSISNGTLAITYGGTGGTTAQTARTNLLPSQTGASGLRLTSNGSDVQFLYDQNFINVKDYGATGNGSTDDSSAFIAALNRIYHNATSMDSMPGAGFRGGFGTLYIPAGKYRISQAGALTPPTGAGTSMLGFRIIGDGMYNTQISYDYGGSAEAYLINGIDRMAFTDIEDIGFYGASGTQNFLLFACTNSAGRTVNLQTKRVLVDNFRTGILCSGTFTASETKHFASLFHTNNHTQKSFVLNNSQTLNHDFFGCEITSYGVGFEILSGGAVRCYGGSHVADSSGILARLAGDPSNHGRFNDGLTYYGTRFELYGSGVLLKNEGVSKIASYNEAHVTFVDNASGLHHLSIIDRGKAVFNNCLISENFRCILRSDMNGVYANEYTPSIYFDKCGLSSQLANFVTINDYTGTTANVNSYGRAYAYNCWNLADQSFPENKYPLDVAYFGHNSAVENTLQPRTYIWTQGAAYQNGLPNGAQFTSGTFKLPLGSTLRKVAIERTEQFATWGFEPFTHRVVNNDATTTFVHCSGHPAHIAQTFWSTDLNYKIDTEAKRTIFIMGSGGNGVLGGVGGRVIFEYF